MTDSERIAYLKRIIEMEVLPRLAILERNSVREGWFRRLVRSWLGDK